MVTVSVFRFRPGGYVGDAAIHSAVIEAARSGVAAARERGELTDGFVVRSGGGLAVVAAHRRAEGDARILKAVRRICEGAHQAATALSQHVDAYDPCAMAVAEIAFDQRPSEPVLCFVTERASAGALDGAVYRAF